MARRVARLTLDNLTDLVGECSSCLFWQLDPVHRARACGHEGDELSAWVSEVLREWGSCGRVVYVDDVPVGHIVYAPAVHVPGAAQLATAPVSGDAVLLVQARVAEEFAGQGLGRVLVQAMAKDLLKRGGIKAVEAFGATDVGRSVGHECVVPVDFLLGVGFRTQRSHPRTPRMRMELRSLVTWRSELEGALDRLLAPVRHQVPVQQPRQQPQPSRRSIRRGGGPQPS